MIDVKLIGRVLVTQCQFLGNLLVSWSIRKQNKVAFSSTKAKYIRAGSCAQIFWIKHQLEDHGINFHNISIKCDNTSAIALLKKIDISCKNKTH